MPVSHSSSSSISFEAQGRGNTESKGTKRANDPSTFSIYGLPTSADIDYASYLLVFAEDGSSIPFRTILSDSDSGSVPNLKTIVCFIRHFLCPFCQDYMYSISRNIHPEVLKHAGLRLVIIGNGGWEMIKSYRRIFNLPYPIYTDPTATLYATLGMTLRTLDPGPKPLKASFSASGSGSPTSETYVRHRSIVSGVSLVLRNAVKARMPIWKYMGDKALLGGEFVFRSTGDDFKCVFAHRMQYTTAHEEIGNVMDEACGGTIIPTAREMGPCSGVNCNLRRSPSLVTVTTSLSRISSSSVNSIELGQVETAPRPLSDLSLAAAYDPVMARILSTLRRSTSSFIRSPSVSPSSCASCNTSTSTGTKSSWKAIRDRELWLMKEKKQWRRLIGFIGQPKESDIREYLTNDPDEFQVREIDACSP